MKKKLIYIFFALFMSMGLMFCINQNFSSANAMVFENVYVVSNSSSDNIHVESSDDLIFNNFNSWQEAISEIESNASTHGYENIYIKFNDFNLDDIEDNYLFFNGSNCNYVLTGFITSSYEGEIIKIDSVNEVSVFLEDITLECENSEYVISFDNKQSASVSYNFKVGGSIDYVTKNSYFMKYVTFCDCSVTDKELVSVINMVLPNNLYNEEVFIYPNNNTISNIQLYPESDYYSISRGYDLSNKIIRASSCIYVNFNTNGGEFVDYIFDSIIYIGTSEFPNSSKIIKEESQFKGWFGTINYDSKDYYFDLAMLEAFSLVDYDYSLIDNYFVTSLDDNRLSYDEAFKNYNYSSSEFKTKYFLDFFIKKEIKLSFVAKWELNKYKINYVTNSNDLLLEPETYEFGKQLNLPTNVVKTGYTFCGWFINRNLTEECSYETMPARDFTLYAKWTINSYSISFNSKGGSTVNTITSDYGVVITAPNSPKKEGYTFNGWFKDEALTERYIFETMPAEDITLYAKWVLNKYNILLFLDGGYFEHSNQVIYNANHNDYFNKPTSAPIKEGFEFDGWYTSELFEVEHDFTKPITSTTHIYAKWKTLYYELSFDMGVASPLNPISKGFNEDISIFEPRNVTCAGYKFIGWTIDDGKEFVFNTMPARDIVVKANWQEKETLSLDLKSQSCTFGDSNEKYEISSEDSNLSNFVVYYKIDGEWTILRPVKVGSYDVKVIRYEDDTYKMFEKVLTDGFSILRIQKDMGWLILLFYFLTFVEIVLIFLIKKMRKMKVSTTYSVAIGQIYFISTGQMVHLVLTGIMFIVGFVYFMHEMVVLSRSVNNENFDTSKLDTRERFKDDLEFQRKVLTDPNYTSETKTKESFGNKYSDKDIEQLLKQDHYADNLQKTREDKILNSMVIFGEDETDESLEGDGFIVKEQKSIKIEDNGFVDFDSKDNDLSSNSNNFTNNGLDKNGLLEVEYEIKEENEIKDENIDS